MSHLEPCRPSPRPACARRRRFSQPLLLAALCGVLCVRPAWSATAFSAQRTIAPDVFSGTTATAADVDRDGDLDVVWGRVSGGEIAWQEQLDDGSFVEHDVTFSHSNPADVAVGDLDGDGDSDLVFAFNASDAVAWYENDGNQLFTERLVASGLDFANGVALADVDCDGDLDVLSTSGGDDTVAWHENDGDGSFTRHDISTTADGANDVVGADLDSDGDVDVVSTSGQGDVVAWFENDGNEAFTRHALPGSADLARAVAVGDLDRDGNLDVVAASGNDDRIRWYESDGAGTFTHHFLASGLDNVDSVALGDLDADGDLDVLSASFGDDTIAWQENLGGGSFVERTISTTAATAQAASAADLDGDGDLDVLAIVSDFASDDNAVVWFENLLPRETALPAEARLVVSGLPGAAGIDAADVDGDGDLDIAAAAAAADGVWWFRNAGNGGVDLTVQLASGDGDFVDGVGSVELFDLDRDGDLDVLTAAATGGDVAWHVNPGHAAGAPISFQHQLVDGGAATVRHATAGDLDGDGDLDIVAAVTGENAVEWYAGDGTGRFTSAMMAATAVTAVRSVDVGDVDGDGDLDIAFAETGAIRPGWLENLGGAVPSFARRTLPDAFQAPFWASIADFDGDGRADLLFTSFANDKVAWYRNTGGSPATFLLASVTSGVDGPTDIEPVDLDRDGDLDFVVAARDADRAVWFENAGPGTFPRRRSLPPVLDGAIGLVAADLDRDGTVDLAVACDAAGNVQWVPNRRALFWDDFESGGTAAWSARTP